MNVSKKNKIIPNKEIIKETKEIKKFTNILLAGKQKRKKTGKIMKTRQTKYLKKGNTMSRWGFDHHNGLVAMKFENIRA